MPTFIAVFAIVVSGADASVLIVTKIKAFAFDAWTRIASIKLDITMTSGVSN